MTATSIYPLRFSTVDERTPVQPVATLEVQHYDGPLHLPIEVQHRG